MRKNAQRENSENSASRAPNDSPEASRALFYRKIFEDSFPQALFVKIDRNPLCDVSQFVETCSGFTGSSGFLIVYSDGEGHILNAIFVDARYTIQAQQEGPDFDVIECKGTDSRNSAIRDWCDERFMPETKGYHVNLSMHDFELLQKSLSYVDFSSMQIEHSTQGEIEIYDPKYCGRDCPETNHLYAHMSQRGALLLSSPESIAWIYNLRAKALNNHAPTFPCLGLATYTRTYLFIPADSFDETLNQFSYITFVQIPCGKFYSAIGKLIGELKLSRLVLDDSQTPQLLIDHLPSVPIRRAQDRTPERRCIKNETEIANAKIVCEIDSAAVIKLIAWLDNCDVSVTERDIASKLEEFRQQNSRYKGPSFHSIVATGKNAAIVHHHPTDAIAQRSVLIDVGGQYYGGTTDQTRTIWIGKSPQTKAVKQTSGKKCDDSKRNEVDWFPEFVGVYTRVLRGHVALAKIIFPEGTAGANLDVVARQFLWNNRQNYEHGTGHGIGSYLSVHEGPCGISQKNMYPLKPGMILSNEPGFYKEGLYGVRLENMMCVREDLGGFLRFETLTLIPFCSQLVDFSVLTDDEKDWLNAYHTRILRQMTSHLDKTAMYWLTQACQPFIHIPPDAPGSLKAQTLVKSEFGPRNVSRDGYTYPI
ncbi:MAG: M24 family metallopeptidase [Holosporales bacterium]|jgi:Xaa-Pro aminopeptidase|nr:M24 family metallopeptidase [Holosporales bacterium]